MGVSLSVQHVYAGVMSYTVYYCACDFGLSPLSSLSLFLSLPLSPSLFLSFPLSLSLSLSFPTPLPLSLFHSHPPSLPMYMYVFAVPQYIKWDEEGQRTRRRGKGGREEQKKQRRKRRVRKRRGRGGKKRGGILESTVDNEGKSHIYGGVSFICQCYTIDMICIPCAHCLPTAKFKGHDR